MVFGLAAMLGAYGGGRIAGFVPAGLLIGGFAAMMLATGVAMLRPGRSEAEADEVTGKFRPFAAIGEGLVVGAVTGLIGAGGGFLVVPALVLLGGMPLRAAIGTSLLVVSMKSFAGFAGHLGHVSIDFPLAATVTVVAALGAILGGYIGRGLSTAALRRAFAALVIGMSAVVAYGQLPEGIRAVIFVERWPFWVGGLAIAAFVVLMLLVAGKPLGVSTGFTDLCAARTEPSARKSWRLPFLAGISLGGLVAAMLGGGLGADGVSYLVEGVTRSPVSTALLFTGGGLLIGFGTRLAGGCTSGHGIVGMAQLARSSVVSTVSFMATGFVVANVLSRILGG
jgi:uncharacterized membrane protein YfcA